MKKLVARRASRNDKAPPAKRKGASNSAHAAQHIEQYLRDSLNCNEQKGILRSESRIIRRLLKPANANKMRFVYDRLSDTLSSPHQWKAVIGEIVTAAAFWSPARMKAARKMAARLRSLDVEIGEMMSELSRLAALLEKRQRIAERYAFDVGDGEGHLLDLIEDAGRNSSLQSIAEPFLARVLPEIETLRAKLSADMWPTHAAILREMDMRYQWRVVDKASYKPLDSVSEAALSQQSYGRMLLRALDTKIVQLQSNPIVLLPSEFHLSPQSISIISDVALGLHISARNVITARNQSKR